MKKNRRSLILPLSALLTTATGLVQAGPMDAMAEGSLRPWGLPGRPVSEKALTGFQTFLETKIGTGLAELSPSLRVVKALDPKSEAHLRAAGKLVLSGGQVQKAVKARADEITAAVRKDDLSMDEFYAAAAEIAPFTPISDPALAVNIMALEAHWSGTMDKARRIAAALSQDKGLVALDPDWRKRTPTGRSWPAGDPSGSRRPRADEPAASRPLTNQAISRGPDNPSAPPSILVGVAFTAVLSLAAMALLTVGLDAANRFFVSSAASAAASAAPDERDLPYLY